jgi:hypothetical protein
MANRLWLSVRGAALVAAVAFFSGAAQAIVYPITYDPPTGLGTVQVRDEACLVDDVRCVLDLLTTDLVDSDGNEWLLPSPALDVADPEGSIIVDFETRQLVAFDSVGITLILVSSPGLEVASFGPAEEPCTATLRLFSDNSTSLTTCFGLTNTGIYVVGPALAPEPASLALIVVGVAAAWAARRRRTRA